MIQNLIALMTGVLFGLGLAVAQMIDRARVLSFMDIAGKWDPTLLVVLGGATGVTLLTFRLILRWRRPVFARSFVVSNQRTVDRPLVIGAALFGMGWGISGYCPGPGLAALAIDWQNPALFIISVVGGVLLYQAWQAVGQSRSALGAGHSAQTPVSTTRSCG